MGLKNSSYRDYVKNNLRISWLANILQFPIYLISKIFPKRNLSIYGSMNGFRIADNSKYHYLNNKVTSKVFILKDQVAVKTSKSEGYNSVYCYSLNGLWAQLTADHVIGHMA